jgi:hypothetical protein
MDSYQRPQGGNTETSKYGMSPIGCRMNKGQKLIKRQASGGFFISFACALALFAYI